MKIAILCQEEPVFLGPFLQEVLTLRPRQVAGVFIAGRRGGGEKKGSPGRLLESQRIYWKIMEPGGYLRALLLKLRAAFLGGSDPRSVAGTAAGLGVAVHHVRDPNGPDFLDLLRKVAPDLVLNQSELLLRREVLSIPRRGFINRHASLLPAFRGRLASFWSHAAPRPRYGQTIHVVDEGIDSGPVIVQREYPDIDPRWPYPKVMQHFLAKAPVLLWEAVDLMARDDFEPREQAAGERTLPFPSLEDARRYRLSMKVRRHMKISAPESEP